MNNCFKTRASGFLKGRNLLLGLLNEKKQVEFVFEVVNGRFGDFEGKVTSDSRGSRQSRAKEVRPDVSKFLKKHGVLK